MFLFIYFIYLFFFFFFFGIPTYDLRAIKPAVNTHFMSIFKSAISKLRKKVVTLFKSWIEAQNDQNYTGTPMQCVNALPVHKFQ